MKDWEFVFSQVIILSHDFFLLIQYFLPQKIILRLTEVIQTCAENILTETIYIF